MYKELTSRQMVAKDFAHIISFDTHKNPLR